MDLQYDYRPKWTIILLCALFFGTGALVFGVKANGNDHGLIINGILELPVGAATVVYWILAALSISFVLGAIFLAIVRLTLHKRITINETSITLPRPGWSNDIVSVPFGDIVELSMSEVSGQRFLNIIFNGGKHSLTASMLPRKEDLDEICTAITQGMRPYARLTNPSDSDKAFSLQDSWKPVGVVIEGQPIQVGGLNPWHFEWKSVDVPPVSLPHPSYPSQRHPMRVYEISSGTQRVVFAAGELSANVWGFFVPAA